MSYSRYWNFSPEPIPINIWEQIQKDFKIIVFELKVKDINISGPNGTGKPIIDSCETTFNGKTPEENESFTFVRNPNEYLFEFSTVNYEGKTYLFNFCKTAKKGYDLAVACYLLIAKNYLKEKLIISSDGNENDWLEATKMIQKYLGYSPNLVTK